MKAIDLKNGTKYIFTNESFQHSINKDDIRECECYYVKFPQMFSGFKIWFNGELIHSSKTFSSFERRFNVLKEKWNLELKETLMQNF